MDDDIEALVRSGYAAAAASGLSSDTAGVRAVAEAFGYSAAELAVIPSEANLGLSCGNPTALASLHHGEIVVDLGSGGGMDVFLAAAQVGPEGKAIGIDMRPEMVALARRNASKAGAKNVEFHLAPIDLLPLPAESVDCVISNCVINLAPNKPAVFREIYRVLRPGGRVAISDIATKAPLPDELAASLTAYVGCLAGAISMDEYRSGLSEAGFDEIAIIDTGTDLNAYALVANQSCCCSPSMTGSENAADTSCGPIGLHEELSRLLARFDVNYYASSVRVYALKPATQKASIRPRQAPMPQLTLLRQASPLADAREQVRILETHGSEVSFAEAVAKHGLDPLRADGIETLQVNLGRLCNQTCRHCHVDAGPDRRETMSFETVQSCLDVLARFKIPTLDITGGAPEMNAHFQHLVREARRVGCDVIDRCNLTILLAPGYEQLATFLADNEVRVVASLPCYLEQNTDAQRGQGVFARSIEALRRLNAVGFGHPDSGRSLDLVFNPQGPVLPPPQTELEAAYRRELHSRFGIVFNRLFTITNMPISRFLNDLLTAGRFEEYLGKLAAAFNPATCERLMCRTMISVDWRGYLYDCDFNQMLDLPVSSDVLHISEFRPELLANRPIVTGRHCYGCAAGAGSSCQGTIS